MAYQPLLRQQQQQQQSIHSNHEGGPNGSAHPAVQPSVPDIPGTKVLDRGALQYFRERVAALCHRSPHDTKFPGAQPVSFEKTSIDALIQEDFWVCEKSDGQRVLVFITFDPNFNQQVVFLINRKNEYFHVEGLHFPAPPPTQRPDPNDPQIAIDTLLDGELVWDAEANGKRVLRLLLFDALVVQGVNIMDKGLGKRYGRLRTMVFDPFFKYMDRNNEAIAAAPFEIKVKSMDLSYHIEHVLHTRIPSLKHGNDGLIFTCWNSRYTMGTDPKILKWKPPSENSIDFKLQLRFPPTESGGRVPDMMAKPFFMLMQWHGDGRPYSFFDWADVTDEEWEEMKRSGRQYDDVVVECVWEPAKGELPARWVIKRIRDDKRDGNFANIVQAILKSIRDGVEADELIRAVPRIREAWKSQLRNDIRQGKIAAPPIQSQQHKQLPQAPASRRGGPGPPMVQGGSIPNLIRR